MDSSSSREERSEDEDDWAGSAWERRLAERPRSVTTREADAALSSARSLRSEGDAHARRGSQSRVPWTHTYRTWFREDLALQEFRLENSAYVTRRFFFFFFFFQGRVCVDHCGDQHSLNERS